MSDRSVSWCGTISEELNERGPVSFTAGQLGEQKHLFAHRCALFYTPTGNIPVQYVGSSPLDIVLPLASPCYTDSQEVRGVYEPSSLG